MKEKVVAKLMSGKFLVTVCVTLTGCYLGATGQIPATDFMKIFMAVVGGYFIQSVFKPKGE